MSINAARAICGGLELMSQDEEYAARPFDQLNDLISTQMGLSDVIALHEILKMLRDSADAAIDAMPMDDAGHLAHVNQFRDAMTKAMQAIT